MKRIVSLVLAALLTLGLAGCALFPYRLSWEVSANARAVGRVFEARDVYYSEDPLALGGNHGVSVLMENSLGIEPVGPVEWEISDASVGTLVDEDELPPSRRNFSPAATGIQQVREAIVSATFEEQTATTKVVVFPSIRFSGGNGIDLDGDGTKDIETIVGDNKVKFPFGVRSLSSTEIFPVNLGELSLDTEAPANEPVIFSDAIGYWRLVVFNTSTGRKFAGIIGGGSTDYVILWRPLDIAY